MRLPFYATPPASRIWIPIVVGLGGALIGAATVALLTPKTGEQLRDYVRQLFEAHSLEDEMESDESQLDRMSGEGGVGSSASLNQGF